MTATQTTTATSYTIDPLHSRAHFKVRHLMIAWVRGEFQNVSGTVSFDPNNLASSSIVARIDASTIKTGVDDRDTHLKSGDFLDVANFPTLEFKSTAIRAKGDSYEVDGELTIHGVTKPETLVIDELSGETKDPWGNTKRGATATARINRKDFGLTWNAALETGGVVVGEEIQISIELELTKLL